MRGRWFGLVLLLACFASAGCSAPAPIEPRPAADAAAPTDADAATPTDSGGGDAPDADARDAATQGVPCPREGCPRGTACFTVGCLPVLALGEACSNRLEPDGGHPTPCDHGARCGLRDGRWSCVPAGSLGAPCYRRDECGAGLTCLDRTRLCEPGLPAGALCAGAYERCASETTCALQRGTLRCAGAGTLGGACIPGAVTPEGEVGPARCDAGLECVGSECIRVVPLGGTCDERAERCASGSACVAANNGLGPHRCVPEGAPGFPCIPPEFVDPRGPTRCDDGLACAWRPGVAPACRRRVERGGECDPTGATTMCGDGDECSSADPLDPGRCVAAGTAAGATCRATTPRCDGDLVCSAFSRYRATCRRTLALGDACDVGAVAGSCPAGSLCLAAAGVRDGVPVGRCAAPVAETEPNDAPSALPSATAASAVYTATLSVADPRDCFPVRVPDGASLRLGVGPSFLYLHLYDPAGVEVGRWIESAESHGPHAGMANVTPQRTPALRALRAGTWSVCVTPWQARAEPERYTLAVAVIPPGA